MGFLGRLLHRSPPPAEILAEAIERLQVGVAMNLSLRYGSQLDRSEALDLANCVLSHAILLKPHGKAAQEYQSEHPIPIRERALELAGITEVAEAISYLYAAITLHLAIQTKDPLSEEAGRLGDCATELLLYIPNTYDICGSGDAVECIRAIAAFADDYLKRAFGR